MIETAVRSFQRRGYSGTSWRTLVDEAGTPWGSIHHHFPDGKEQLGLAAIDLGNQGTLAQLNEAFANVHPAAAVKAFCHARAQELADSDYVNGCPITTVALETASTVPALAEACCGAYADWQAAVAEAFTAAGIKPKRAADLAMFVVGSVEGALLLARISRSQTPLHVAGDQLAAIITEAMPITT